MNQFDPCCHVKMKLVAMERFFSDFRLLVHKRMILNNSYYFIKNYFCFIREL